MDYEDLLMKHKKVIELDDSGKSILQSIRFMDDNQSIKAGSLLIFCSVMIAVAVIQFGSESTAYLYIENKSLAWYLNWSGLWLLFTGALLSVWVFFATNHRYLSDVKAALIQFDCLVGRRHKILLWANRITIAGAICVMLTLSITGYKA